MLLQRIRIGIAFVNSSRLSNNSFDKDGNTLFHTKGIANNIEDPVVSSEQVLGKVVHRFFLLSLLGKITTNKIYLFIFITVPMALLISFELIKMIYKNEEEIEESVIEIK